MTHRSRRRLPILLGTTIAVTAGLAVTHPTTTQAAGSTTSSKVAYINDSTSGGSNLFSDDMGAIAPGGGNNGSSGSYTTASPASALTVTVTNEDASFLGTGTALSGFDTVIMYDICDVASYPQYIKTLNTFIDGGGKLIILDGAQCVNGNGGIANWGAFERPFSDSYTLPDPQYGAPLPYTFEESGDPLTAHLPDCGTSPCNEAGNAVSDASVINVASTGWCESLGGTDTNGVSGAIEAYTHNSAGTGLIVYEGEPFALSTGTAVSQKHLRLVFDDILNQAWNTDGLGCSNALSPAVNVPDAPLAVLIPAISLVVLGALAVPAFVRRRRLVAER